VVWVPIIIVSNTLRGRVQVNDARRLPFGSKTESTPKLKIIERSLKLLGFNDVDAFLLNQMLCKKTSLPREKLRSVTGPVKAFPLLCLDGRVQFPAGEGRPIFEGNTVKDQSSIILLFDLLLGSFP